MSGYPPPGSYPPYYHPPPPGHPGHPPPPPNQAYAYMPTPVLMPIYQPPQPEPVPTAPQPTYVTNYIYQTPQPEEFKLDWVPASRATVSSFSDNVVVAGKEGWDNSPLWVIRAHHSGELVPGKLAIKHRAAYIPFGGAEIPVHNFEVLTVTPNRVQWMQSSNGQVPPGAIIAGNSRNAEPLYIGRVTHMNSLTPGKVHPSHGCCYISFGGQEISYKGYEVLCKIG